jgi:hypothetical protein
LGPSHDRYRCVRADGPVGREVLRSNGVLALYSAGVAPQPTVPLQFRANNIAVRFVLVYDMPKPAKDTAVQEITQLLEGESSAISQVPIFPWSQRGRHTRLCGGSSHR